MTKAIRHLAALAITGVLRGGGGAVVSARQFSSLELTGLARALKGSAVLHVTDSQLLSALEMTGIARSATAPAYAVFSGPEV